MSKILVRVRPDNKYKVSAEECYYEGQEFQVDEAELKAVPHCLVSVEQDDALKLAALEQQANKAQAQADLFNAARQGAIDSEIARRQGLKQAAENGAALKEAATKRVEAEIARISAAPLPKPAAPKTSKKPDMA